MFFMVIITTSDLQKNIGSVMTHSSQGTVVVTKHGKAKVVMLPYFDDNEESLVRYYEDMEMHQNRKALQKKYQISSESVKSGVFL
jgi:prevent-host-death family protein